MVSAWLNISIYRSFMVVKNMHKYEILNADFMVILAILSLNDFTTTKSFVNRQFRIYFFKNKVFKK